MKQNWTNNNLDVLLFGVLRKRTAHGYEVIQQLKQLSEGLFDLAEGTVYPSLRGAAVFTK
jgi:PadR family transcriptional regulator PadR